jgi:TolB-like protein/Tfp pilus assembly protein PilF
MVSSERPLKPVDAHGAKRKLAAILSADVAGYSRLMGADETGTHERLLACRGVIDELIAKHDGRVVQTGGDSVLADFPSVVEALLAAVDLQKALGEHNLKLSHDQRLDFRIGINLGDVIVDGDDIFGDGVNVAARVQALAEPGGIAISGAVYEQVSNKLDLNYRDRGSHTVKNIAAPVRVYSIAAEGAATRIPPANTQRIRLGWLGAGVVAFLALAGLALWFVWPTWLDRGTTLAPAPETKAELAAEPTIAVLPFENQGGDPDQEYFADGVTEDLITALGRFSSLLVMSWEAVAPYQEQTVTPKQLSAQLNVRYVVDGSVRRAGERVRVTARLTDAERGVLLWSDRYDKALDDIFAVQDDITRQIAGTLTVKLSEIEQARAVAKPTDSLAAYDYYLRGRQQLHRYGRSANLEAEETLEKAIELDPSYADAYVGLGWVHLDRAAYGWTEWPHAAVEKAAELARQALRLKGANAAAHGLLASAYIYQNRYDLALAEVERALELNPNAWESHSDRGWVLLTSGRTTESIEEFEAALRLNPNSFAADFANLGSAYFLERRYDDAITTLEGGLNREPEFVALHIALAAAYAEAGRDEDAKRVAATVRRLSPFFEVDAFGEYFRDPAVRERFAVALRKAGLE